MLRTLSTRKDVGVDVVVWKIVVVQTDLTRLVEHALEGYY
jgi:hypothetical protein